jgi:hypothetical protein
MFKGAKELQDSTGSCTCSFILARPRLCTLFQDEKTILDITQRQWLVEIYEETSQRQFIPFSTDTNKPWN